MLDLYESYCFITKRTYQCVFTFFILITCVSIYSLEYQDGLESLPTHQEASWVKRYFDSVDEETTVAEIVDFLIGFKSYLQAQGYDVPVLSDFCLEMKTRLIEEGLEIDDDEFSEVYNEVIKRESALITNSSYRFSLGNCSKYNIENVKKKKNKDLKVSGRFAVGFCKALAGALCCIIPHPVTLAIGSTLVVTGIENMISHAGDDPDPDSDATIEELLKRRN
jgi:hypothetical protein